MFILLLYNYSDIYSQAASYSDPAAAYQRILLEKSADGSYQQIGNFKVIGSSYLFGPQLNGNVYTSTERSMNVNLSYNTYNQKLEVYQSGLLEPMIIDVQGIDSFRFIASIKTEFKEDLVFVSSLLADPNAKGFFLQLVATGPRYNLYKAYKSSLTYVSTNYIQSELRQFDLTYEYYYSDLLQHRLKKLKISAPGLKKEFSEISEIDKLISTSDLSDNPEYLLKQIFAKLNTP